MISTANVQKRNKMIHQTGIWAGIRGVKNDELTVNTTARNLILYIPLYVNVNIKKC